MLDFTEDTVNQTCVAKSEKLVTEVTISKEISPFSFFVINFKNGKVPKELNGRYTSINAAKKALESYLRNKPKSRTVQRNEYADMREKERNAAKSRSEGS